MVNDCSKIIAFDIRKLRIWSCEYEILYLVVWLFHRIGRGLIYLFFNTYDYINIQNLKHIYEIYIVGSFLNKHMFRFVDYI